MSSVRERRWDADERGHRVTGTPLATTPFVTHVHVLRMRIRSPRSAG